MGLIASIRANLKEILYREGHFPLAKKPRLSFEAYSSLFEKYKDGVYPEVDDWERQMGFSLNRNWLDKLAFATQVTVKSSELNWQHGRVIYSALRRYLEDFGKKQPVLILETGSARGFSSICLGKAIVDSGSAGTVVSIDLLPPNLEMLWNVASDHSGKQSRMRLLRDWHEELERVVFICQPAGREVGRLGIQRVNFAFLDAEHTFDALAQEFRYVSSRQVTGDVIVVDDYSRGVFEGVVRLVDSPEVQQKYDIQIITSNAPRSYAVCTRK